MGSKRPARTASNWVLQSKAIARGPRESPGLTRTILNPAGVIISTSDTTGTLSTVPPNGWNVTFQSTQQYYGTEYTSITVSAPGNAPLASGYEVIVGTPGYYFNAAYFDVVPSGPAAPPTDLTAAGGNAQVTLTWLASSGATSYNVYMGTQEFTDITALTYTATGLTNGDTYSFTVTAVNTSGESAPSTAVTATPMVPPAVPASLAATAGNALVVLSWDAVATATSYDVFRGQGTGAESATPANTSPIIGQSYTDTGLTNGTTYYYTVAAVNSGGTSSHSNEANGTPNAVPFAITSISNGQSLSGDVQIQVSCYGGTAPPDDDIYLSIDGGSERASSGGDPQSDGSSLVSFGLSTEMLTNGTHTITVSDGVSYSDSRTVYVNNILSGLQYDYLVDPSNNAIVPSSSQIIGTLPTSQQWQLTIYDVYGQEHRQYAGTGPIGVSWDGNDDSGNAVLGGTYTMVFSVPPTTTYTVPIIFAPPADSLLILNTESFRDPNADVKPFIAFLHRELDPYWENGTLFQEYPEIMAIDPGKMSPAVANEITYRLGMPMQLFYIYGHGRQIRPVGDPKRSWNPFDAPGFNLGSDVWWSTMHGSPQGVQSGGTYMDLSVITYIIISMRQQVHSYG